MYTYVKKFQDKSEMNQNLNKPVVVIEKATGKVIKFKSMKEAVQNLGYNDLTVRRFLQGKKTHKIGKYYATVQEIKQMVEQINNI